MAPPHTRGWTLKTKLYEAADSGSPAHSTRGDGPFVVGDYVVMTSAPPHTRGWTRERDEAFIDSGGSYDRGPSPRVWGSLGRGGRRGMARGRDRGVKPFGHAAIAKFLDARIDEIKAFKTQREIAEEVGFNTPNMISMLKNGDLKIPLDKIALLARALDVDPGHLLRLDLEQYWTWLGDVIDEVFGHIASANEFELFLKSWRQVTENTDPKPTRSMKDKVEVTIDQIARTARRSD